MEKNSGGVPSAPDSQKEKAKQALLGIESALRILGIDSFRMLVDIQEYLEWRIKHKPDIGNDPKIMGLDRLLRDFTEEEIRSVIIELRNRNNGPIALNNFEDRFADLPEKGFLFNVELFVVDTWSTQYLNSDQMPLIDLWGPDAPRGHLFDSLSLDKRGLIEYITKKLPEYARGKLEKGIPVGIKITAWPEDLGDTLSKVQYQNPGEIIQIANTTLVPNLKK